MGFGERAVKKGYPVALLVVIALSLVAYVLWPTDEERIRRLFREGVGAAESEDLDALMSKVSFHYHDDYGLSYLTLKENLRKQFEVLSDIRVEYEVLRIQIEKKTATVEVGVRAIATMGSETGYILGDIKTPLALMVDLEKERAKWLIARIEKIE